MAVAALVLLTLSLPLAPALRVLPDDSGARPPDDSGAVVELARSGGVPQLDRFRKLWTGMYGLEKRLQEPMPQSVQLVIGVMSVASSAAAPYREVLRETWLQQRGVCYWSGQPQANCSVYVAFVFGSNGSSVEEPGALALKDCPENMNKGKSMVWFAEALQRFPWATHIGKMDVDAYPFLHKLLARMDANRSCVASGYEWIGRSMVGGKLDSNFTGACEDRPCMGWYESPVLDRVHHAAYHGPFSYMQGQMYILSKKLAAGICRLPMSHRGEDKGMGFLVQEFTAKTGQCVAVRRLDASAHLSNEHEWKMQERELVVDGTFANDLEAGFVERKASLEA